MVGFQCWQFLFHHHDDDDDDDDCDNDDDADYCTDDVAPVWLSHSYINHFPPPPPPPPSTPHLPSPYPSPELNSLKLDDDEEDKMI